MDNKYSYHININLHTEAFNTYLFMKYCILITNNMNMLDVYRVTQKSR